jgi:hypothetical protein
MLMKQSNRSRMRYMIAVPVLATLGACNRSSAGDEPLDRDLALGSIFQQDQPQPLPSHAEVRVVRRAHPHRAHEESVEGESPFPARMESSATPAVESSPPPTVASPAIAAVESSAKPALETSAPTVESPTATPTVESPATPIGQSPAAPVAGQPATPVAESPTTPDQTPVVDGAPAPAASTDGSSPAPEPQSTTVKHTDRDAAIGAAAGAITGAVIGRNAKGAMIGAAAGGILGAIIGNNADVSKRTNPYFRTVVPRRSRWSPRA